MSKRTTRLRSCAIAACTLPTSSVAITDQERTGGRGSSGLRARHGRRDLPEHHGRGNHENDEQDEHDIHERRDIDLSSAQLRPTRVHRHGSFPLARVNQSYDRTHETLLMVYQDLKRQDATTPGSEESSWFPLASWRPGVSSHFPSAAMAASTSSTWPLTLTGDHRAAILPLASMRKVDRMVPVTGLPYIIFLPYAPHSRATALSWS